MSTESESNDEGMISLGACPTCKGPAQFVDDGTTDGYVRHVDLATVRMERFREIVMDAIQKLPARPNYNPSDLLHHGVVMVPTWDLSKLPDEGPCGRHPPGVTCLVCAPDDELTEAYRAALWEDAHFQSMAHARTTSARLHRVVDEMARRQGATRKLRI